MPDQETKLIRRYWLIMARGILQFMAILAAMFFLAYAAAYTVLAAPDYGVGEERVGRYISSRRNEFYLATKCGCVPIQHEDHLEVKHVWTSDVIQRNIATSLQRLRTDYVDVLQFHGGDAETLQREGLIAVLVSNVRKQAPQPLQVASFTFFSAWLNALGAMSIAVTSKPRPAR